MKTILLCALAIATLAQAAEPISNPLIDYPGFIKIAGETAPIRLARRITEAQFAEYVADRDTVVLDARSADKYALRHIRGAVSLPFTDFTAESLARVIPTKSTRVLIYCNNNFIGAPVSLTSKSAPASLNISTYIALATYGYTNVYELGPLLDVKTTKLSFTGTEIDGGK
jgi:phage shock protein E